MPWSRRGANDYYYLSRQIGGKTRNTYLGKGAAATLAIVAGETGRLEREVRRGGRPVKRSTLPNEHQHIRELCTSLRHLVREELLAAGYHQHARGQWRRRRDSKATNYQDPRQSE